MATTEGSDELLRTLGLLPSNGVAQGGVDLLAATLERFVTLDGPPAVLIVETDMEPGYCGDSGYEPGP